MVATFSRSVAWTRRLVVLLVPGFIWTTFGLNVVDGDRCGLGVGVGGCVGVLGGPGGGRSGTCCLKP